LVGDKGKVYSFEPQRIIYYQLCGNVFVNGLDNIYCHNLAIGNSNDAVYINSPNYHEQGDVNFGDVRISHSGDVVEQKRLDDFEFTDLVFIKIDVQGYEEHVINGAIKTIQKHRPYMFVEFEEDLLQEMGSSEDKLTSKIESLGYVVRRFQEGIPYQTTSGKCLDCVCIPEEKFKEFNHIIP
jgi:FkbM family methyltransferase